MSLSPSGGSGSPWVQCSLVASAASRATRASSAMRASKNATSSLIRARSTEWSLPKDSFTPRNVKLSLGKDHSVDLARINELVAFLLARIADDARVARDAAEATSEHWTQGDPDPPDGDSDIVWLADDHQQSVVFPDENGAAHSARWDPARVLAECHAKQLIAQQLRRRFLLVGP